MTPGARIAASITILDAYLAGKTLEQALSAWARQSRYAGSKDRAEIRDIVFAALRQRQSCAAFGDGVTGRAWMIAFCKLQGLDLQAFFSDAPYHPKPLEGGEADITPNSSAPDQQDWIMQHLRDQYGAGADDICAALKTRAPISIRAHLGKINRDDLIGALHKGGVTAQPNPVSASALTITEGVRKLKNLPSFADGLFEFQDAASQSATEMLPAAARVLDYCAGGGGKSLALAARQNAEYVLHDINPARMADAKTRAARAGAQFHFASPDDLAGQAAFDLVFCDCPCSGSGTWRRTPEEKWRITAQKLDDYVQTQRDIFAKAIPLVAQGGHFAHITCSVFSQENTQQAAYIQQHYPHLTLQGEKQFLPDENGDGLYVCVFKVG